MDIEGGMLKQTHITAFILKGQVDIQNEKIWYEHHKQYLKISPAFRTITVDF